MKFQHPFIAGLSLLFSTLASLPAQAQLSPNLFSSSMDPKLKAQVKGDLDLAASIKFSKTSALHQQIFGKQNAYISWFSKKIKKISLGKCMGHETAVACVLPIFEPEKMQVTQRYLDMNAPQVARMSVMFHEAKHTEYNPRVNESDPDLRFWMHAKCPAPFLDEQNQERTSIWTGLPLSGVDGCDIVANGSYGTVVVMLRNISRYSTNTNEKLKADAEIYAADQQIRIIDAAAIEQLNNDQ